MRLTYVALALAAMLAPGLALAAPINTERVDIVAGNHYPTDLSTVATAAILPSIDSVRRVLAPPGVGYSAHRLHVMAFLLERRSPRFIESG